jgi:hypothetical protein
VAQSPIRFVRGPARAVPRPELEAVAAQASSAGPLPAASDMRWRELIELDARLGKERGIRLLTPEARVLLFLTLSGPVSVTEAMQAAGTSYRGFYTVLERLKQAGLVAASKDDHDQRVRRLKLGSALEIPQVGS